MNWRFWTWGRTVRRAPEGRFPWLEDKVPPCPTFYCENCQSNEPHGMVCDAIYGERKKCVRCFTVTPVRSAAQVLFSDDNLRPDIGFDEARIKLEIATRVYNEWAVKYALWRESGGCVPVLMPSCGDNGSLRARLMTINRIGFEDEPQYTD